MDERAKLLLLSDIAGPIFGTEDFGLFLYSLVRLHAPRTIVELGTGLGVSSFWMALAAKRNRVGHVWTVDDLSLFETSQILREIIVRLLPKSQTPPTPQHYFHEVSRLLQLEEYLTFVYERIDLEEERHFDRYPFGNDAVDLLFSDFLCGPSEILALLGHFLPRMSPASSIFIDSASATWPCYLLLEQLIGQLNRGQVPEALQDRSYVDLHQLMRDRRIVLTHITKFNKIDQNSTAWMKIEPVDIFPHPKTVMAGL